MSNLAADLEALLEPTPGSRLAPDAPPVGKRHQHRTATGTLEDFDGARGALRVDGQVAVHDWQEVLKIALPPGFDPEEYVLVGNPRVTSHTALTGGEWENIQAWWKIQFARKDVLEDEQRDEDAERLVEELSDLSTTVERTPLLGDDYFVINFGDWQLGQHDSGGSAYTVARLKSIFARILGRVEALRAMGRPLGSAVVAGGGDLFEGCRGFYPMQTFTVDLDRRQQAKVVRRLLVHFIKMLAQLGFERIILVGVPGNHGENRNDDGKAFTSWGDNDDVAVWEQVHDIIAETALADLCEWKLPEEDLTLTLPLAGRVVAWTHGHQCRPNTSSSGEQSVKVWRWWEQQAMRRTPAGEADMLNVFHFHHYYAKEDSGIFLLGNPAACGSSKWWQDMTGQGSTPGQATYVVTEYSDSTHEDLQIITP